MKASTSLFIEMFDVYGKDIPLQISGSHKQKTKFGALMGMISLAFTAAVSIYFLTTLFSRTTKQVLQNEDYSSLPQTNLSQIPILFSLTNSRGPVTPDPTVWNLKAYNVRSGFNNTVGTGVNIYNYEIHPCTRTDLGQFSQYFSDTWLSTRLCIAAGSLNQVLNSYPNDLMNGWDTLEIQLTKCDISVNPICKNATYVNQVVEGARWGIQTFMGTIDNSNNTDPRQFTIVAYIMQVSNLIFKTTSMFLTQNLYHDDQGFIFESVSVFDFFSLGAVTTDYYMTSQKGNLPPRNTDVPIATITIGNSNFVLNTNRSYLKAQAVLANIGGISKIIMSAAQVIAQFVTRKSAFVIIANDVFDYSAAKKETNKKKGMIELDEKKDNDQIEIEGKTDKVLPGSVDFEKRVKIRTNLWHISPSMRNLKTIKNLGKTEPLTGKMRLNFWEQICIPACVKNKKVMNRYQQSEKIILEKISIHSIIQDSFKLEKLSKLTLNDEKFRQLNENNKMPFYGN